MKNVCVRKGGKDILNGVSLGVQRGSFFVLMGPSGCGKTTLLRLAALLDRPDGGEVLFNGIPPATRGKRRLAERRRVAMVFQNSVLFRGTVVSNISWALKMRGVSAREIGKRVERILHQVDLEGFADRDVSTLSGGEVRRTALARALVLEPELLILDEPTTSLDPPLKRDLLRKTKLMHEKTDGTFLMATHHYSDALAVGTSGAVMRNGRIEQSGLLEDIVFKPESRFMADFMGIENVFHADFRGNEAKVGELIFRHSENREGSGFLAVPPEVIVLSNVSELTSQRNTFRGVVNTIERKGANWEVVVQVADVSFAVAVTTGALDELDISTGCRVYLFFKASAVHLF